MPGPRRRTMLATMLAAVALSACGGDEREGLSNAQATELLSLIGAVDDAFSSGDCLLAADAAAQLRTSAGNVEQRVDTELRDALTRGAVRLEELVVRECGANGEETTETTETETTEPTTEPTTTTETTETTTTTETTEPEPPIDGGDGDGDGGSGGVGE